MERPHSLALTSRSRHCPVAFLSERLIVVALGGSILCGSHVCVLQLGMVTLGVFLECSLSGGQCFLKIPTSSAFACVWVDRLRKEGEFFLARVLSVFEWLYSIFHYV